MASCALGYCNKCIGQELDPICINLLPCLAVEDFKAVGSKKISTHKIFYMLL